MSLNSGIPPKILQRRFSSQDITDLLALEIVNFEKTSKEDIRLGRLIKNLEHFHQFRSQNDYVIDWHLKEQEYKTPYEKGMEEKAKWMRL